MRRGAPLPQVWRDLLPTPRLSHLHFQGRKPGPYRGEPHAGPTLPGESAVRPAHSSPTSGTGHTQVNHLPTLSQDTEASTSRTTPWPQLGLLPREAEALQAPQPRGGPNYHLTSRRPLSGAPSSRGSGPCLILPSPSLTLAFHLPLLKSPVTPQRSPGDPGLPPHLKILNFGLHGFGVHGLGFQLPGQATAGECSPGRSFCLACWSHNWIIFFLTLTTLS